MTSWAAMRAAISTAAAAVILALCAATVANAYTLPSESAFLFLRCNKRLVLPSPRA